MVVHIDPDKNVWLTPVSALGAVGAPRFLTGGADGAAVCAYGGRVLAAALAGGAVTVFSALTTSPPKPSTSPCSKPQIKFF
jgi:hypothetical protein